ncbi:hypothetical protein RHMOL_Rhmol02G0244200 [Rhododendron molle]|uniref:Uncharacterized protein n=1 Tax=Rhododendron molle TaxID=49168 RepID=A0ACC0PVA2_RHOML|nr:hypothetical protein RHMOL_Rhmol02G0244200 [Rhododendron molle]
MFCRYRREDAFSLGYDGGRARIFNIYPRKGAILVGSDADIIILNPNSSFGVSVTSHHPRSNTNVFDGRSGKGKVEVTISRGRVVWENGRLNAAPGFWKVHRNAAFWLSFSMELTK